MLRQESFGPVTRFDLARTLAGRGRYWTTCYLLEDVLIDSGCAHTAAELAAALRDRPLRLIANTHGHEDHIGANGLLQQNRPGLAIRAHPLARPLLANPRSRRQQLYRRVMWGWPMPSQAAPLDEGDVLEAGPYRLHVLATPGHSPDHLCFYEPQQGWLFSGDLYIGGRDRALRAGYDVWGIIASLKRVAALPLTTLFPGAARVRPDPAARLDEKIDHLEALGRRVLDLNGQGLSVAEIARRVMGRPMFIEWMTLDHFSRRRLVLSYLGRNPDPGEPIPWDAARP
jgi:glyoxylase-like metal-dependent hydrolase (beta-lactamase superfamily II)